MTIQEKLNSQMDKFVFTYGTSYEYIENHKVSSILLYKDYLRRLITWKKALNAPELGFRERVHNNLFNYLNPNWKDEIISFDEFRKKFVKRFKITNLPNGPYILDLFINWEIFKERDEILMYDNLEHPYEGVIKIIKNKDYIFNREFLVIGNVTIAKYKSVNFKLPSIEDEFLNYIDSKFKLTGNDGIPNQQVVDNLWDEFKIIRERL